jgi:hypothetical protein
MWRREENSKSFEDKKEGKGKKGKILGTIKKVKFQRS